MLTRFFWHMGLSGAALWIATQLFPHWLHFPALGNTLDTLWAVLWAGLVLGLCNSIIRPILGFLAFPITALTFGLFSLVINAGILGLVASNSKLELNGFGGAFCGGLVVMVLNWFLHQFMPDTSKPQRRLERPERS
jgi:putative membrane protein